MEQKLKSIKIVLTILRAVLCYGLISLASLLSHYFVSQILSGAIEDGVITLRLVSLYSAIFYFVFLFCYTRLFALYHKEFREDCALCREYSPKFFSKIKSLFGSSAFLIPFGVMSALLLVTNSRGYGYLAYAIFGDTLTYGQTYLVALPMMLLLMLCLICAYIFAAKSIREEPREAKERRSVKANRRLVWETVKITFNTVAASVLIPLIIIMAANFIIFLIFFPAVIAVFLAFIAFRYLRALRIRHRFIRSLKQACENRRYRLSKIKRPYLSLFVANQGESFTLTVDGKVYSCKLVHAIRRNVPMFFHQDGYGTVVNTISVFRIEIAHHVTRFHYAFDSNNDKIVIVCPVPKVMFSRRDPAVAAVDTSVTEAKFIYAGIGAKGTKTNLLSEIPSEGGVSREMDVGEAFAGYKFFNGSGFLNALERGVLDR